MYRVGMSRPSWNIGDAAERCGVSRSTVRRYRESGRFPNAFKDTSGAWKIPLEDLLAVGWSPVDPSQSAPAEPVQESAAERVRELEQALALERVRRESAERLAAQTEANLSDLRTALRMLEGNAVSAPVSASEPALGLTHEQAGLRLAEQASEAPEQPKRRRWWNLT